MKITITKFYEADDGGSGGIDWYQEFKRVNKELTELKSQFQHPVPDEAGEDRNFGVRLKAAIDKRMTQAGIFDSMVNSCITYEQYKEDKQNFFDSLDEISLQMLQGKSPSPAPPSGEDAGKGWISVEDKTPIAYKTGVWDGQKSDLVLTYNAVDDTHCIATLYEGYLDGNHFKDWYHVDDFEIPTPTHWKPLTAPNP